MTLTAHSTHCCPVHGCKYGSDDCKVSDGTEAPAYGQNNGCEVCEFAADRIRAAMDSIGPRLLALADQWEQHSGGSMGFSASEVDYEQGRESARESCADELRELVKALKK